ncbi:plasmid pRiA4b ORF-3 family protein [Falsibacillus pallidus]|uniref:PRiA4b ORF-3-like protein n=1 Tax=Falsibacillus pallidus TaxID=493781 RepID=A0A370G1I0_9BACI|nr:plasmid pRiA4b ORF-3 family protein [Falsibacillus pallidus]RDI36474.1 pRiA4b ORF-3-like protein [Falsibacillus pallidus]
MRIHCTKKLLDVLKVSPANFIEEEEALFSWHANVVLFGRKKAVVLVNNKNRYAAVLFGLKAKDLKEMGRLIPDAIREVFRADYIKEEIINQYLQHSSTLSFDKTNGRKMVARLNRACEDFYFAEEMLDESNLIQLKISKWLNNTPVGNGKDPYFFPNKEMYNDLEEFAGRSIFQSEAVQLKATLELKNHSVWRRLIVPKSISFPALHDVLQTAFDWQNSHLHEFVIWEKNSSAQLKSSKPVLRLVCHEEALAYQSEIAMELEAGHKLSDYISKDITYNYDFGDGWAHKIEVERVIEDYPYNYPTCESGEGNAPPEDVGGEAGFEEFLRIIHNSSHPDHEQMREWGKMQGYEEFNIKWINRSLK